MVGLIVFSDANSIRMNLKTLKINLYIASMQKKNRLFKKNSFICFLLKKTLFFLQKKHRPKKTVFCPSLITIDHLVLDGLILKFTSTGLLHYVIFTNLSRFHALST